MREGGEGGIDLDDALLTVEPVECRCIDVLRDAFHDVFVGGVEACGEVQGLEIRDYSGLELDGGIGVAGQSVDVHPRLFILSVVFRGS